MAEQYWVGGFFVDLSRNQITQNEQTQTIAPKALAVLTYLAEHQGKVVSQDALLDNVWQGSVVSPNTLQRSIAQLRKALGDDGKVQVFIKTHAKQGYSLESEVRWGNQNETPEVSEQEEPLINETVVSEFDDDKPLTDVPASPVATQQWFRPVAILMGLVAISLIAIQFLLPSSPSTLSIGALRALTATDHKEYSGIYSPDGEFVVFNRYIDVLCISNIWAKNLQTQEETALLDKEGTYGSHSFSEDGKHLAFVQSEDCNKPSTQRKCYKLMMLDFKQAMRAPMSPTELMECRNTAIRAPIWLDNDSIVMLQQRAESWQLIRYSVSTNDSQVIYAVEDGNIIDFDYSRDEDLIALTSYQSDGEYFIEVIKTDGELLSSHPIQYPPEIAKFRLISPNFSPIKGELIFSTGRQLFTLSHQGQVTNISLPLDEPMGTPVFHPDGDRMLVIKGYYDSDIVPVPLEQIVPTEIAQVHGEQSPVYPALQRSNLGEDTARFQPGGDLIAFESERSGEEQVWIADGQSARQLSQFPMDTNLFGMDWAADGQSLLVNANYSLSRVFLDGRQEPVAFDYPITRLYQWDSENNTALLLVRIKGAKKLAELNLVTAELDILYDNEVNWALRSANGQLIYLDSSDKFWRPGPAEDQLIEALEGQGGDKQVFLIRDNEIFGVNDDYQLWSFDLEEEIFTIIGDLPHNLDYLTDINQDLLLMSIRVSAKKEVAELFLQ